MRCTEWSIQVELFSEREMKPFRQLIDLLYGRDNNELNINIDTANKNTISSIQKKNYSIYKFVADVPFIESNWYTRLRAFNNYLKLLI